MDTRTPEALGSTYFAGLIKNVSRGQSLPSGPLQERQEQEAAYVKDLVESFFDPNDPQAVEIEEQAIITKLRAISTILMEWLDNGHNSVQYSMHKIAFMQALLSLKQDPGDASANLGFQNILRAAFQGNGGRGSRADLFIGLVNGAYIGALDILENKAQGDKVLAERIIENLKVIFEPKATYPTSQDLDKKKSIVTEKPDFLGLSFNEQMLNVVIMQLSIRKQIQEVEQD